MDLQVTSKKALITGSSAGIGYATAQLLAREGAEVILNARTQARVDEAVSNIKKSVPNARVSGIAADLGTAAGAAHLVKQLPDVDILVNNVGMYQPREFEQITDEEWLTIFQVNVMSGVRLSREYLPKMKEKNWGRIIFVSSESGVNTPAEMIHYGVTKTAQLALARGLAESTIGSNVTVNSVLPGPTASEGVDNFVKNLAESKGIATDQVEKEFFAHVRPSSLIQRFATSEEVANMIVYLASPLSSATNGAALRVDGGVVRSII